MLLSDQEQCRGGSSALPHTSVWLVQTKEIYHDTPASCHPTRVGFLYHIHTVGVQDVPKHAEVQVSKHAVNSGIKHDLKGKLTGHLLFLMMQKTRGHQSLPNQGPCWQPARSKKAEPTLNKMEPPFSFNMEVHLHENYSSQHAMQPDPLARSTTMHARTCLFHRLHLCIRRGIRPWMAFGS